MTQQVSNVVEAKTPDVKAVQPSAQKPEQNPKQILDPAMDPSFGFAYKDKFVAGIVAIDVLLLPVLLSVGKPDSMAITALNMLGFSLPAAGGYVVTRLQLPYNLPRWQAIHDRFPRWGKALRFFFFSLTMLVASGGCCAALITAFQRVSRQAGDLFLITGGTIGLVFILFVSLSDFLLWKENRTTKREQVTRDDTTQATPTPPGAH